MMRLLNSFTPPRPKRLSATMLGHSGIASPGARARRSKQLQCQAAPHLLPSCPASAQPRHRFSSSRHKTQSSDLSPISTQAFPSPLLTTFPQARLPPIPTTAGHHPLSPQALFVDSLRQYPNPAFPSSPSNDFSSGQPSPNFNRRANPLPLKHFFSNTIATSGLPLANRPVTSTGNRR